VRLKKKQKPNSPNGLGTRSAGVRYGEVTYLRDGGQTNCMSQKRFQMNVGSPKEKDVDELWDNREARARGGGERHIDA